MTEDDDHEHQWKACHEQAGLVRCTADGCDLPDRALSIHEAQVADHWSWCPAPPDAGCATCHEYARTFLRTAAR